MTPIQIKLLIEAYEPTNSELLRQNIHEVERILIENGMMKRSGALSEGGEKLVEMLMAVPFPVCKWVDPRDDLAQKSLSSINEYNNTIGQKNQPAPQYGEKPA